MGASGSSSWDEDFYWQAQGRLIEEGRIVPGRGKGGSVQLAEVQAVEPESRAMSPAVRNGERGLYAPIKAAIEQKWIKRFGFDAVIVEETHSRGSRDTGGTFTRPDCQSASKIDP